MKTLDHKRRPVVAVTGMGCISSLGRDVAENWQALTAGWSGIREITRFATNDLKTTIAGTVDLLDEAPYSAFMHSLNMARRSAREAMAGAGIGTSGSFPGPLFIATPPAEFEWPHLLRLWRGTGDPGAAGYERLLAAARGGGFEDMAPALQFATIAERLADEFGVRGQPVSVCTACASGATAIALGVEAIRRGETGAALAVGTDGTVHPEAIVRFSLLSALSTANAPPEKAAKPFARDRDGFVPAEGAAALVLEDYDRAVARGATVLGIVSGCGEKADDYHRTRSKPDGSAMIGAVRDALDDAGLAPEQIDTVNAHGTSTPENDKMEALALEAVFGERAGQIPVTANKSTVGHTLIAAGALEAVYSLMTLQSGTIAPTLNCDTPDPDIRLDIVRDEKRDVAVQTVLSNSFGFGGQNACLVFSHELGGNGGSGGSDGGGE